MSNNRRLFVWALCLTVCMILSSAASAQDERLRLKAYGSYEYIRGYDKDTIYVKDSVVCTYGVWTFASDTVMFIKNEAVLLKGHAFAEDTANQINADIIKYDINRRTVTATGEKVVIISRIDSLKAVGHNAWFSRDSSLFRMSMRPTMYVNYEDTARMIQIMADRLAFNSSDKIGYADGDVIIRQTDTESKAARAILYADKDIVTLLGGKPVAKRKDSYISGDTLVFFSDDGRLERINVMGNALGDFTEPNKSDSLQTDHFELKAFDLDFYFAGGELNTVIAARQAYSFYSPAVIDSSEVVRNHASGDTIKLYLVDGSLSAVNIIGGAEGQYLSGHKAKGDHVSVLVVDTIEYCGRRIDYDLRDSTIVLTGEAEVISGKMSLAAARIDYLTTRELVLAYDDSAVVADTGLIYYPVILNDGSEQLLGSYLEYSLANERGLIHQSKTEYQEAFYRGQDLYRVEKDVYYVKNGVYIPCEREDGGVSFWARNMKMIRGDKIIARPVVFHIEKIPLMIVPYYVFPIKPGRHSGFLPFKIGNFEQGSRYLQNVGYYWAASEYWDLKGSMDYFEDYGLKFNGELLYNVRYKFNGSLSGSYGSDSYYVNYEKVRKERWSVVANHAHTVSPTLSIRASGNFISDKSYYTDFSTDENDRLNRNIKSQLSISKRFGNTAVSAQFSHTDNIDDESRSDLLPSASISFPSRRLFGSSPKDDGGQVKGSWYNDIYLNYNINIRNFSSRKTLADSTRSRREYAVIDHNTGLSLPFSLFRYLKFNLSLPYQETWYKVFETDQSIDAGIDASRLYRRYAYSASMSAGTDLYGNVTPNAFGLEALRHVLTPRVTYSYAPKITKNDAVRSYTGSGGGSSYESQSMTFSLSQLFQAKIKSGEQSKNLTLLTLNHSLSYNFEAEGRKFSDLTTSAQTTLLKYVSMSAGIVHELYEPNTDNLKICFPYLKSFYISSSFKTSGIFGHYHSAAPCNGPDCGGNDAEASEQSWDLSVRHYYQESGRGDSFRKAHTIDFTLELKPSPNWRVIYSQYYDIAADNIVRRSVEVHRALGCWQGRFYWKPDGSNSGYGFVINVIQIPDIKVEKSESGTRAPFF